MEQRTSKPKNKWEFTKKQAIIVTVIGSLLLLPALIITTETGTTAHMAKVILGFIGACVIFVGVWRRPMGPEQIKQS